MNVNRGFAEPSNVFLDHHLVVVSQSGLKTVTTTGGSYGRAKPKIVQKSWGREEIFINTEMYCMKALYFNPGCGTSIHFHCSKHETFFVSKGSITLKLYNKETIDREVLLVVGDSYILPPGLVHSIHSYSEESCLIEASTFSQDEDSNRLDLVQE